MTQLPTACIIGAGSSGIAIAKAFHERGIPFECIEKSDRVGGNWVWKNKNGMSSSYRNLHINTSDKRMEYSDFPMPADYPDFPHHSQIARYFDAYVDHFGFRDRILFDTGVEHAERLEDGTWEVRLDTGDTRCYDALVVANGHHWDPRWPEPGFPGQDEFEGEIIHSHHFTGEDPNFFRDKKVVVLGMGNSAMDIAGEAAFSAEHVYLSARRGAYIVPKYMFGRPLDQIGVNPLTPLLPWAFRRLILETMYRVSVGRVEDYGLPKPDHKLGHAHPTISAFVLDQIAHGDITSKPNIASFTERSVRFEDGSEIEADLVVFCTGYKVSFPFFGEGLISAPDNDLPLYRRVFHPEIDNVFFAGLLQPLGAIMPLAEAQGQWIAAYLRGEYRLPAKPALRADIARERTRMNRRYVASKRHTMQVDFDNYLHALRKERRRGLERARSAGFRLPVPGTVRSTEEAVAA